MKKEFIKIIVALVVLFGIAIPLSLYRGNKMKEEIAKDDAKKFITFDLRKIDRFQIVNKAGITLEIEKREKEANGKFKDEFENRSFEFKTPPAWIITQPYRALADDAKMDSLLGQLEQLAYNKEIQSNLDKKSDYDLGEPNLTLRFFEGKKIEPKLSLYMGSENTAATGNYFSASDKPGIYLGDRTLQTYVTEDRNLWKERRIIDTPDMANIQMVGINHLAKPAESFSAKREKAIWTIIGKKPVLADQRILNNFVDHVNAMRFAKSFEDSSVVKNSKKIITIDWKLKDHDPIQLSIYDGGKNSDIYYVQRSDLPQIFQIAAPDAKLLQTYQDVVDKHLLAKSNEDIVSMKISQSGGRVMELQKTGEVWKINKPFADNASIKRIESFTQVLRDYQGLSYLSEKVLNVENQKMRIDFGLKDQSVYAVTFYQEGKNMFASVEDSTEVRTIAIAHIPPELYEHLSHFRSDDLISISVEHLKGISISKGEAKIEIQRNLNTEVWSVLSIENVTPTVNMKWREQMTAQELFNRVSEMYVTKFLPSVNSKDTYTELLLTITSDEGKSTHWNFGKKEGEMVNVFSTERNVAGLIPWIKFKELSEFLAEPQKTAK